MTAAPLRRPIENPVSGELIVVRTTAAESGGSLLAWELFLRPGGRVPASHAHPEQEERFTVVGGVMGFRVGRRSIHAEAGRTAVAPTGTVHAFRNPGERTAHVLVETRPALNMEALLETAAALAREATTRGGESPRALDLGLFLAEFEREVQVPWVPRGLARAVARLAHLASSRGMDARYRRLSARAAEAGA